MKKIFLSGDPTHPLYHRYQNVAAALESVFEAYEIACVSEHFETFETQDYEKYDLAVLYTDHWIDKTGTSHQQVQALVDYVAGGGALLVLHNLDIGVDAELAQMLGARLRRTHPAEPHRQSWTIPGGRAALRRRIPDASALSALYLLSHAGRQRADVRF